jgi:cytidylate kinase
MKKCIITLGREYCTGGRFMAEKAAEKLGLKCYDRELITMAAKNSGLSEEAIAASEKQHTHSLLYNLYTMGNDLPLSDQVFILQSRIVKELAEQGPCVILGRCADYVLRERPDVLRVFVTASPEFRLKYAKSSPNFDFGGKPDKEVREAIAHTDKKRSAYYNYYTQNRWGDVHNYDLTLNAELGEDACVEIILKALAAKEASL